MKEGRLIEDMAGENVGAAKSNVSELVDDVLVGGAEVPSATCKGATAGLRDSSAGCPGLAAAGPDSARFASALFGADDIGAGILVPIAEDTATSVVGTTAGCSAGSVEEGGSGEGEGGGCSTGLVCICGACSTAVEVVNSVGVTTDGSSVVTVDVAAVRARERVHRLPLTVVIDSCGEAMQTIAHRKKRQQGLKRGDEEKGLQTPQAL